MNKIKFNSKYVNDNINILLTIFYTIFIFILCGILTKIEPYHAEFFEGWIYLIKLVQI